MTLHKIVGTNIFPYAHINSFCSVVFQPAKTSCNWSKTPNHTNQTMVQFDPNKVQLSWSDQGLDQQHLGYLKILISLGLTEKKKFNTRTERENGGKFYLLFCNFSPFCFMLKSSCVTPSCVSCIKTISNCSSLEKLLLNVKLKLPLEFLDDVFFSQLGNLRLKVDTGSCCWTELRLLSNFTACWYLLM